MTCSKRGTHILDGCSAIHIGSYNMLEQSRATHILEGCSAILSSDLLVLKTLESNSHPWQVFSHFWSAQRLERDSHPGWVFSHSYQWFQYPQTLKSNSQAKHFFQIVLSVVLICSNSSEPLTPWMNVSHQWLWSAQMENHSPPGCMFSHPQQ